MAVKQFIGMGVIKESFAITPVTTAPVREVAVPAGKSMTIAVDHLIPPAIAKPQIAYASPVIAVANKVAPAPAPQSPPLPSPLSALGTVAALKAPAIASLIPNIQPQKFSQDSAVAPYETLFHNFNLTVIPFYNFWVGDETTNDHDDRGDRKLEDIPRYIQIVWDVPPDMPDPYKEQAHTNTHRPIEPVKFGLETEKSRAYDVKGVAFTPDHLQPSNFSLAANNLSNGFIGPGMVNAMVELPLHNTGLDSSMTHAQNSPVHHIDEDVFLSHEDTEGVSIHELKANIHQMTNGALGAARVSSTPLSVKAQRDHSDLFEGNFAVHMPVDADGQVQIHNVDADGPSISIVAKGAVSSEGAVFDPVIDMVMKVTQPAPVSAVKQSAQVKVVFVHPSMDGAISNEKISLMSRPHHAESTIALAHALPNLEVLTQSGMQHQPRRITIPSYPSPTGIRPIEYIGYILEKYQRTAEGVFELAEVIELASRDYNQYFDTRVLYGEVYRYRIRAVVRWTRPSDVGVFGKEPFTISQPGSQTAPTSPFKSSYFGSEWSPEWQYGMLIDTSPPPPPDELVVRPESGRKRISVSFRLPDNPQRDIYIMRLFRKLQDVHGHDLTDWIRVLENNAVERGVDFAPQNVLYYDADLVDYFQVNGIRYVYAAQCISRHHEFSPLSEQLGVRLNKDFVMRGEFPVEFVSCAGVKREHLGSFAVYPHHVFKTEVVVAPEKGQTGELQAEMMFGGRNVKGNMAMNDSMHFVRIESLDTGEKQDIQLNLDYNFQPAQTNVLTIGAYVPLHSIPIKEETPPVFGGDVSRPGSIGSAGSDSEPSNKPPSSGRI